MKPEYRRAFMMGLAIATLCSLLRWSHSPPGAIEDKPPASVPRQRGGSSRALRIAQFRDPKTTATRVPPPMPPIEAFAVCGRAAGFHRASWARQRNYDACPKLKKGKRVLVLKDTVPYGKTGNQLQTFLRAVQYARDQRAPLAIVQGSWAMQVLLDFFLDDGPVEGRKARLEKSLCVEILPNGGKLPRAVQKQPPHLLFRYESNASQEDYVASQMHTLRTLFQHYNTGTDHEGTGGMGTAVRDMCSGIDSLFAAGPNAPAGGGTQEDPRSAALYSAIHLRSLDGKGRQMLAKQAVRTGCDPVAALEMRPAYVKAILAPVGMLAQPIVVITDGQEGSREALDRLRGDPEIGPMIRVVPEEALWLGGDITLAVMATLFIGNPASTMSGFIARSRVALGFEDSNYMYLTRDEDGVWSQVHGVSGEDEAYTYTIYGP